MAPADELLVSRVEDFLAGLQAAKRSAHTIGAYRDDLIGVAARIACQLHGPDAPVERLAVSDLDGRVMRHAFAGWASDHAAASMVRAWGTWNRFFGYLIDDEALERNPMKAVPKPSSPQPPRGRSARRTSPRPPGRGRDPGKPKPGLLLL
jgi:site-specific recombinase XerC